MVDTEEQKMSVTRYVMCNSQRINKIHIKLWEKKSNVGSGQYLKENNRKFPKFEGLEVMNRF